MLLQNSKFTPESIISLKLVNGDEVVTRLISETATEYTISHPTVVVPSRDGVALMQAMFSGETKTEMIISKSHVMLISNTIEQLADHYREMTTGIQTVRKSGIII